VRHTSFLAATALAITGLALAGCGSSSNSGSGKSEASGSPTTSETSSSSSASSGSSSTGTTSGSSPASAAGGSTGTAITTVHTSLGTILAAGSKRLTVYLWEADKGSTSTCSGPCAQVWPPVTTTSAPQAEGGAVAADLGTTTRSDGTKQVTYNGHPLYWYTGDSQTGETTGQGSTGFGASWYVMSPSGSKIING
jgi:predicted lipoprotein with Yx(FWY)xxD motif